jgi:hypothetical protein
MELAIVISGKQAEDGYIGRDKKQGMEQRITDLTPHSAWSPSNLAKVRNGGEFMSFLDSVCLSLLDVDVDAAAQVL